MTRLSRLAVLPLALLLGAAPRGAATVHCILVDSTPRLGLRNADMVFVGEVLDSSRRALGRDPTTNDEITFNAFVARHRVLEVFKGHLARGDTIETLSDLQPDGITMNRGWEFVPGMRYLIYARRGHFGLYVTECGRTTTATDSTADILALRTLTARRGSR